MHTVSTVGTTKRQSRPRARYSVERIEADMSDRKWNDSDLARAAGVSVMTISRFMRGETQTKKVAGKIADAFGYSIRRYFSHVETAA